MSFLGRLFQPRVVKVKIQERFQLHNRVGQGSMSKVWKATDRKSGRTVALKVLDKEKTLRLEQRFVGLSRPREGEIAVTFKHPNVVETYEHGLTSEDEQFLVMEFIEGLSLTTLIDVQNPRMKASCLSYCAQLGEALIYFHSQKWIHRDLCPRNIVIANDNTLKLIDFGLAVPNTPEFRKPGNRTGTANYMAPELIKRQPTDERIDIFSYAVTCYEMLTKTLPWPSADSLEAVLQHVNNPPRDIQTVLPALDPRAASAVMKGLQRDPRDRWQAIKPMAEEFRQAAQRTAAR